MPPAFIGLDGEMSGIDWRKHRLIQIGVASGLSEAKTFVSDIGWADYSYQPEALAVNGFTHERIMAGTAAEEVDDKLVERFGPIARGKSKGLVPVGWNVAGFDMPYVRLTLPRFSELLSYRTVDLNAVCFALAGNAGNAYRSVKHRSKEYAEALLNEAPQWHDAGYDARASLAALEYLTRIMKGEAA